MTLSVHLHDVPPAQDLQWLQETLGHTVTFSWGDTIPNPEDLDVLVKGRPHPHDLDSSPGLKILVIPWAGVPLETQRLLRHYPQILIHNLHHNAAATAETAIALLLAAAKFVVPIDQAFRHHDWRMRYQLPPVVTLEGRTALVLGYGAIGQRIAKACKGLGMGVRVIRRQPTLPNPDSAFQVYGMDALPSLLPHADVLLVALPLTEQTRDLLGHHELGLLPTWSVLVNIGRGEIINEAALYEALRTKRIRAAGLDVWYNYPADETVRSCTPPSVFPFHSLDNVVMSPHRAGSFGADEVEHQRYQALAEVLAAAANGDAIPNRVDLQRGY